MADALSRVDTVVMEVNTDLVFPQVVQLSPGVVNVLISQPSARKARDHDAEIEYVHNKTVGHFGLNETLRRLRQRGTTWSGMRTDVESYIRTCHVCQQLWKDGTGSHGAKFSVSVLEPNQRIAMDSIGPLDVDIRGYKYILVFIDREFINDVIRTFLRYTDTVPINPIPYSHEDNAIVERVIEEVRRHLAAFRLEADPTIAW